MKNRNYKLILDAHAGQKERSFAVELAHLIGFVSAFMSFPILVDGKAARDENTTYFYIGENAPKEQNVIWVKQGEEPEKVWMEIYKKYLREDSRQIPMPKGYISAFANSMAHQEEAKKGGLELLFEKQWILMDHDKDGLPDDVNCRLFAEGEPSGDICYAACNLAARLGMESTGISYPLLTEKETEEGNLIILRSCDTAPAMRLVQEPPFARIILEGKGEGLKHFTDLLCQSFPLTGENTTMKDVFTHLGKALSLENADGQAAWLESGKEDIRLPGCSENRKVLLSADGDLTEFGKRWPGIEFHHYNDCFLKEEREYKPAWDMEEIKEALEEQVFPKLQAGDKVEITCAIWQDAQERKRLEAEIKACLEKTGAYGEVSVLCAYKQGLCWLEENFAPRAACAGKVDHVTVRYDIHSDSRIRYQNCDTDWEEVHRHVGKPPRWLQELYPGDELAAKVLGISRDQITFEALPEESRVTYEGLAYDEKGQCIYRDSFTVPVYSRNYLDILPELGQSLPSTGFLTVRKNQEEILSKQMLSDGEKIWEIFQQKIVPWAHEIAAEKEYQAKSQPFFGRMEMEIGIGGPERKLDTRADHISSGEALEDALHQTGQQSFLFYGRMKTGTGLNAPGLFFPKIHIRPGKPVMKARLYLHYGEKPSFPEIHGKAVCRKITLGEKGLEIWVETDLPVQQREKIVPNLLKLTGEGFTGLSRLLQGYAGLHIDQWETRLTQGGTALEEVRPDCEDEALEAIEHMEGRLVGYDDCVRLMNILGRVPGFYVYRAGISYQGRDVYALELKNKEQGYTSRVKRIQYLPTVLINGRHHSNEVSASNAIFQFIKELLVNPEYENIGEKVNLVIIPMENVDGAALHYEIQKEHPDWQHQICYTNSLGSDLMPNYYIEDTIHTEAKVFNRITKEWQPDAFIDLHGVPHHDISFQYGMLKGYRGLWLPQSMLCAFYFHIDDPRFASNKDLSIAWKKRVSKAYEGKDWLTQRNMEWKNRFYKYSWNGTDNSYANEWEGNMLNYWVPSPYDKNHPYPTIRYPWIYSVMFTAEAADETAHGQWLKECAKAHLIHVEEGVKLLSQAGCVYKEENQCGDKTAHISMMRQRPVVAG